MNHNVVFIFINASRPFFNGSPNNVLHVDHMKQNLKAFWEQRRRYNKTETSPTTLLKNCGQILEHKEFVFTYFCYQLSCVYIIKTLLCWFRKQPPFHLQYENNA